MRAPQSPWPELRRRAAALLRDVYAEAVCEGVVLAMCRLPPPATDGVKTQRPGLLTAAFSNSAIWSISLCVASIGAMDSALSSDALPFEELREATAAVPGLRRRFPAGPAATPLA